MSITVRQNLVAASKYGLKCPYSMDAQYITIHNTYNDATADAEIRYMIGNENSTSFHFAVDDKEVVQGIPCDRNAWHCGDGNKDGNRKSIGVEICYSKSGGERYQKAEALAIRFIAQLLKERGWGVDRIRKHQDWSGKYCPHRILDEDRWQAVVNAIAAELASLNTAKKAAPAYIVYEAHVQDIGWQGAKRNGETAGTTGKSLRLEAIKINLENSSARIEVEGHVQDKGWMGVKTNGEVVGTVGESLRLEAIKLKINGLNVSYRVHVQDIGWTAWKKNGEVAGTEGQSKRIEAIEIKLV